MGIEYTSTTYKYNNKIYYGNSFSVLTGFGLPFVFTKNLVFTDVNPIELRGLFYGGELGLGVVGAGAEFSPILDNPQEQLVLRLVLILVDK